MPMVPLLEREEHAVASAESRDLGADEPMIDAVAYPPAQVPTVDRCVGARRPALRVAFLLGLAASSGALVWLLASANDERLSPKTIAHVPSQPGGPSPHGTSAALTDSDRSRIRAVGRDIRMALERDPRASVEDVALALASSAEGRLATLRDELRILLIPDRTAWLGFQRDVTGPEHRFVIVAIPRNRSSAISQPVLLVEQSGWNVVLDLSEAQVRERVPWLARGVEWNKRTLRLPQGALGSSSNERRATGPDA